MTDWHPLAYTDPVPGDPAGVRELARHFGQIGATSQRHAGTLRRISASDTWRGVAADAFTDAAQELPEQLDRVSRRYAGIAAALQEYAPRLAEAQEKARLALARAKEAQARTERAEGGLRTKQAHEGEWTGPNYEALLNDARWDLTAAQRLLDEALTDRDRAALACARRIDASGDDELRTSFWDKVKSGITAAASVVSDVAGRVAFVAGILAIVTAPFPGINAFFAAVALTAGGLALAADLCLYTQGRKTLGDVGLSTLAVMTGGVGKVAGNAAKAVASGRLAAATSQLTSNRAALTALKSDFARRSIVAKVITAPFHGAQRINAKLNVMTAAVRREAIRARDSVIHMPMSGLRTTGDELVHWKQRMVHPYEWKAPQSFGEVFQKLTKSGDAASVYGNAFRDIFDPRNYAYAEYGVAWRTIEIGTDVLGVGQDAYGMTRR